MVEPAVDCESFRAQSEHLITGSLGQDEQGQYLAHAQTCPDCGMVYEADLRLRQGLRSRWRTPSAPRRLRRRLQRRFALRRSIRTAGTVASLGALGAIAVMLMPQRRDTVTPLLTETLAIHQGMVELPHDLAEEPPDRVERFVSKRLGKVVNLPRLPNLARTLSARSHKGPTGSPAAVITYGGGQKRITVLAVPEDGDLAHDLPEPVVRRINGKEVLIWKRDGTVFSATGADGRAPDPFVQMVGYSP